MWGILLRAVADPLDWWLDFYLRRRCRRTHCKEKTTYEDKWYLNSKKHECGDFLSRDWREKQQFFLNVTIWPSLSITILPVQIHRVLLICGDGLFSSGFSLFQCNYSSTQHDPFLTIYFTLYWILVHVNRDRQPVK